jgi:hypothetical protein
MHVKILNYSTPQGQEEFIEQMNSMKLAHEGPLRSGFVRPIVSEWRLFDVRIPEDTQAEFAAKVRFHPLSTNAPVHPEHNFWATKVLRIFIRLFRLSLGMKGITPSQPIPPRINKWWRYSFLLGTIKDPVQKNPLNEKEKREVL